MLDVALLTNVARCGWVKDRMYGPRNVYSTGILEGSIESKVVNIGRVWYGRKVVNRKDVLYSWILQRLVSHNS